MEVPKPLIWEYVWCFSIVLSFLGLSAAKGNRSSDMKKYIIGTIALGVLPLIYCFIYYCGDVIDYLTLEEGQDVDDTEIELWRVIILKYFE